MVSMNSAGHDPRTFDADIGDFDNVYNAIVNGRYFAITEKGFIGFVPLETMVGDAAVVLAGADISYILRPFKTTRNKDSPVRYTVVGDAYIYCLMDGEALTENELGFEEIELV